MQAFFVLSLYICNIFGSPVGIPLTGLIPPNVVPVQGQDLDFQPQMSALFVFSCLRWLLALFILL